MDKKTVPDWKLERYLLGELPVKELEDIRILENTRDDVREMVRALRADNEKILEKYPPCVMGRKIGRASVGGMAARKRRESVRSRPSYNVPRWTLPAAVCAAALLVIPVALIFRPELFQSGVSESRVKGIRPGIEVWRKNGAAAEKLPQDAAARAGDIVQLRYIVPEFCYGALVSMDGRGVLTIHLSGESGKAAPLTPGRPIALDNSYQLDDAPRFETFYLITATDNFDIESVTRSLLSPNRKVDKRRKSSLPQKQLLTAFTLKKEK